MGYFPNGMSGEFYHEQYCSRCVNEDAETERYCPIWNFHLLYNYDECNNDDSWLHKLIPRDGIDNKQCVMFFERVPEPEDNLPARSTAASIRSAEHLHAFLAKGTK